MPDRICSLRSSAWGAVVLAFFCAAPLARAHRLEADYRVLPDQRVQVESWFDQGGVPRAAHVQVMGPDGELVAEGALNDNGVFVFRYPRAQPLKVIVEAGAGHRKEIYVLQADLERGLAAAAPAGSSSAVPQELEVPAVPLVARGTRVSVTDVLIGLGFVLAVAAFVMSIHNARRLRALETKTKNAA
jgi:hypothetical protein